jgi:hypothetical protein
MEIAGITSEREIAGITSERMEIAGTTSEQVPPMGQGALDLISGNSTRR